MAKVMTVLRQPGILRYTASNSEDPREFDETIVLPNPNPNPSSAQASMKPTPFRMLSAVSFCPLSVPEVRRERLHQMYVDVLAWLGVTVLVL